MRPHAPQPTSAYGGEEGIRTLDALLTHTPLAGERLRPLGHLSTHRCSKSRLRLQSLAHPYARLVKEMQHGQD